MQDYRAFLLILHSIAVLGARGHSFNRNIAMHKFLIRAASGIVYAAVICFAVVYGGWALWLLAIAFTSIGVCELDNMEIGFSRKNLPLFILDAIGAFALLSISVCRYAIILWLLLLAVNWFAARKCLSKADMKKYFPSRNECYLALPMAFMLACPIGRLPLLVFILLWLNDSGAYIVGSLMGRHKLCPSISPNKTWEGFIGGVVISMLGAWAAAYLGTDFFGMEGFSLTQWLLLAFFVCIFGTLGDLLESKIKRYYSKKDSGNWIPGHGGILDRIDSFLIAFPAAFLLILLYGWI